MDELKNMKILLDGLMEHLARKIAGPEAYCVNFHFTNDEDWRYGNSQYIEVSWSQEGYEKGRSLRFSVDEFFKEALP